MTAPVDDDARRALEQHALRNVQSLAERLGYRDRLDRRTEKFTLVGIALAVTGLVAFLGILALANAPPANHEERKRCETDITIEEGRKLSADLRAQRSDLDAVQIDRLVAGHMRDVAKSAAQECAEKFAKK